MQLLRRVVFVSGIFLLCFCILVEKTMCSETNLLKNPGFEMNTDGWRMEGREGFVRVDRKVLHKGKCSLKVVADDTPTGIYQFIPHDGKAKLYKLSVWVRTDLKDIKAHVGVDYYSQGDKFLREEVAGAGFWRPPTGLFQVSAKTEWKRYVVYFGRFMPKETAKIKVWCKLNTWRTPWAEGSAWFDGITVKAIEPNPEWPLGYPPIQWKPKKVPGYSKEVKDSGYIVFSTNYLKYIVPDMVPEKGTDDLKLTCFSIPSDYEPITFCIHTLKKLENVKVTASDLVLEGRENVVIPSKNIDVRKVCYLWRRLYYMSYEYLLTPAYLEQFDDVTIEKGKTQQFWLTVKVPEDSVCGKYKGNILISASNTSAKRLKIELEVLPIKLSEPKGIYFGMYYFPKRVLDKKAEVKVHFKDMKEHGMTSVCPFGSFGSAIEKTADGKIKICWDYSKGLALVLDAYKEAGFAEPVVYYVGDLIKTCEKLGGKLETAGFANAYREIISEIVKEGKKRNWPDIYFVPEDEGYPYPFREHRIKATRVCNKILKELRLKSAVHSINHPTPNAVAFAKEFYPSVDMHILTFCHPPVSASNRFPALNINWKVFREMAKREGKKVLFYNVDNTGLRPEAMRFSYGAALWVKGAEGMFNWAYQSPMKNHYDDMSLQLGVGHLPFYYPPDETHKGGPSLGWEAIREGVEDYKLLYTLDKLIEQAKESRDTKKKRIAKKAKQEIATYLSKIDLSRINTASMCILPGKWEEERYGENEIKEVSGDCKIPTGFDWDDYDRFRLLVCKYIMALEEPSLTHKNLTRGWQKIEYHGWDNCYKIQSGGVRLVVVGDVGARIMEYSLDGENILWQDPHNFGFTAKDKGYFHPGGSQFDLLNEEGNGISSIDPELWAGEYEIEIVSPYGLKAISHIGEKSKVRLIKDVSMDRDTGKVTITQTATNCSGQELTLCIWDRTWTSVPCFLFLPVLVNTKMPDG